MPNQTIRQALRMGLGEQPRDRPVRWVAHAMTCLVSLALEGTPVKTKKALEGGRPSAPKMSLTARHGAEYKCMTVPGANLLEDL